ncbi:MAG: 23S rRNA (pseudouridine(1915)-N(3))-methyltransferase RlmH [Selenomonadaceae bacterium]|nr:23S rRNA (pseudouridine(1915)-N(3))-methyltransferase RlmH [Selenomonadaceae bacterium]
MEITIAAVGRLKETYWREGVAEYQKRLRPFATVKILETLEEKMPVSPSPAQKEQCLAREGERLIKLVPPESYRLLLDVKGRELSSEELAKKIADLLLTGQSRLIFIIGGPFGLSPKVREFAHERLSFSRLTFPHQMMRLILMEQLYRAYKINRGEKYHW